MFPRSCILQGEDLAVPGPEGAGAVPEDTAGPFGPALDHTAQKDKTLLVQQGSLSQRRRPTRSSLHALLTALHWVSTPTLVTPEDTPTSTPEPTPEVTHPEPVPATAVTDDSGLKLGKSRPVTPETPRISNPQPRRHDTKRNSEPESESGVDHVVVVSTSEEVSAGDEARTLHRRRGSLDSGCSLDMSSSSASSCSEKGSPDPTPARTPTLTPPPEFADTPLMKRRRRSRRRADTTIADSRVESPTRKQPSPASKHREASPTTDKMPPTPTNIKVNFRIVPRDGARAPNDAASSSRPPVSRSVSCRGRATGAWASWDRRLLAESPSDRYLDDTERRSRSLSRPGRSATYDGGDEDRRDPEWLEIARRRQTTEVDWDNLEARMREPHSISCSNLSESHMLGRVSSLASADRLGLRLVRSASALYPRIKMSRYERRLRRDNRNPCKSQTSP